MKTDVIYNRFFLTTVSILVLVISFNTKIYSQDYEGHSPGSPHFLQSSSMGHLTTPNGETTLQLRTKAAEHKNDSISTIVSLESKVLNQTRRLYISLPEGYSESNRSYPVLYIMPYKKSIFLTDVDDFRSLQENKDVPEMIVVGIADVDGMADLTPTQTSNYGANSGGAAKFLEYVKKEVFPYIDQNYRTKSCRIAKGHSIEGVVLLYALLSQPDMFTAYALSSPYFPYDGDEKFLLKNASSYLDERKDAENFVYFTIGDEPGLTENLQSFIKILESKKPTGLTWELEIKKERTHHTIKDIILTEGLKAIYAEGRDICRK